MYLMVPTTNHPPENNQRLTQQHFASIVFASMNSLSSVLVIILDVLRVARNAHSNGAGSIDAPS